MKRRPKPERRAFTKPVRRVHRARTYCARLFRVKPDRSRPFVVEVRIARTRKRMHEEVGRCDGAAAIRGIEADCMGMVRSYCSRVTGRDVIRPGGLVARMFLNARDLRSKPGEIVSHECGHAAMAWARLQHADLSRMSGEEVMCYALGRLVAQVNRICYAAGVFS
jgi:hypothetical protein